MDNLAKIMTAVAVLVVACAEEDHCRGDLAPGTYHVTVSDAGGDCPVEFVEGVITSVSDVTSFSEPQSCQSFTDTVAVSADCVAVFDADQVTAPSSMTIDWSFSVDPASSVNQNCELTCTHRFRVRYEP